MENLFSARHFSRIPAFRWCRTYISTSLALCLLLIGSAWALDVPGISMPWKFTEIERHYSFLDQETDTRLLVIVGKMRGFDEQNTSQDELIDHVWNAVAPPQLLKQLRFPKRDENGWSTQVFLGQSPQFFVVAKVFMLGKGEMRVIVMVRPSPISFEYFDSVMKDVRVFPKDQI